MTVLVFFIGGCTFAEVSFIVTTAWGSWTPKFVWQRAYYGFMTQETLFVSKLSVVKTTSIHFYAGFGHGILRVQMTYMS